MTNNRSKWQQVISYQRVSTEKQGENGIGLEGQMAAINRCAELEHYRITESLHDVGSGRGEKNLRLRRGLQSAIENAKATGRPIIVADLSRISRHSKTIHEIVSEHGITIISAGDGKLLDPVIVASKAARAEREGELISERTKQALARKKAEGIKLGNRKNLPQAQRLAVAKRKEIADETVREIVTVLDDLPREVTASELVDILNERGIRTSRKLRWTVPAIRRPLKSARSLISDRETVRERYRSNPDFGQF